MTLKKKKKKKKKKRANNKAITTAHIQELPNKLLHESQLRTEKLVPENLGDS